jgi:hypothetical protein
MFLCQQESVWFACGLLRNTGLGRVGLLGEKTELLVESIVSMLVFGAFHWLLVNCDLCASVESRCIFSAYVSLRKDILGSVLWFKLTKVYVSECTNRERTQGAAAG